MRCVDCKWSWRTSYIFYIDSVWFENIVINWSQVVSLIIRMSCHFISRHSLNIWMAEDITDVGGDSQVLRLQAWTLFTTQANCEVKYKAIFLFRFIVWVEMSGNVTVSSQCHVCLDAYAVSQMSTVYLPLLIVLFYLNSRNFDLNCQLCFILQQK